jgi:unconventional prefoldin RPB5 interactor 1
MSSIPQLEHSKVKLNQFLTQYDTLRKFIETAKNQRTIDHFVPLVDGLAYIPGKIKHTNDITCSIGNNYFIKLSAIESIKLLERKRKRKYN